MGAVLKKCPQPWGVEASPTGERPQPVYRAKLKPCIRPDALAPGSVSVGP